MQSLLVLILLFGAVAAAVQARPCGAAFAPDSELTQDTIPVGQKRTKSPPKRAAVPAHPVLTEEQALSALETEISRKVGMQMKEADYPDEARRWKWSGTTMVQVHVGSDGKMKQISLGRTSGFRVLDEQAVRVVSRIASLYWIPERLRGRDVTVMVPIGFILGND